MLPRIATITTPLAIAGAVALLALSAAPAPARAQGSVTLTPWAGIYVPTSNSFQQVGEDVKLNNSFVGGARLDFWGKTSALGLEITAGYSPAAVTVAGVSVNEKQNTNVFLGGAKLMFGSSPASRSFGLMLGLGAGVVSRGKNVLDSQTSQTRWGGLGDVGVKFPLGSSLGLRFDVEDYIYHPSTFDGDSSWQNDLAITAGLAITF